MRRLNCRGESLIELLVAAAVISLTLMMIFQAFISGKLANTQSWQSTMESELASQIIEQLKAKPYADLLNWEKKHRKGGLATGLDPYAGEFGLTIDPMYAEISAEFDLLPYAHYPLDEVLEVVVRAGQTEMACLIRAGDPS
jgi:hypothetical protein